MGNRRSGAASGDLRAQPLVGEDFQQHGMCYPAVDDMCAANTRFDRVQSTADLGKHTSVHGPVCNQRIHLGRAEAGQYFLLAVHQSGNVGQQHELFRLHHLGNLARHQVRVDVIGVAGVVGTNRCDDWNEIAVENDVQHFGVDLADVADVSDIDDFRRRQLRALAGNLQAFCADQAAVLAGNPDRLAAGAIDRGDDLLVDAPAEHHLHHVHRLRVGYPHAVHKLAGNTQLFQQRANLRPATVHDNRVHANQLHQNNIAGETFVKQRIDHGITAELDHNGLAGEALYGGKCLGKNLGDVHRGVGG